MADELYARLFRLCEDVAGLFDGEPTDAAEFKDASMEITRLWREARSLKAAIDADDSLTR